jgi:predicted PurR-regulated permease PerM
MAVTRHDHTQSIYDIAAWLLTGAALVLILSLHLLPALLAGLLVYELVHILAPRLQVVRIHQEYGKLVAVALLATVVALGIVLAIIGIVAFLRSEAGSLPRLLKQMADILDSWRAGLPASLSAYLPEDIDALKDLLVEELRGHAGALQTLGAEAGRAGAHILIGLGIGALISLHEAHAGEPLGPLARSLQERAVRLSEAFRRIVFAQVRISALNTGLTALYLGVILPLFGAHLPFTKTIIVVTFFVGLLPVVGNLFSNTIIVVVSLSVALAVAIASLMFLVVIHKLEYFLNAHIVGTQIHARAWELLLAMLVMEAAFGIVGVIAAPIYYAYVKDELVSQGLI